MLPSHKLSNSSAFLWAHPQEFRLVHVAVAQLPVEALSFFVWITIGADIFLLTLICIHITCSSFGNAKFTAHSKLYCIEAFAFQCSVPQDSFWNGIFLVRSFCVSLLVYTISREYCRRTASVNRNPELECLSILSSIRIWIARPHYWVLHSFDYFYDSWNFLVSAVADNLNASFHFFGVEYWFLCGKTQDLFVAYFREWLWMFKQLRINFSV